MANNRRYIIKRRIRNVLIPNTGTICVSVDGQALLKTNLAPVFQRYWKDNFSKVFDLDKLKESKH